MTDCYVYYRIALDREADARRALDAMLDEVATTTGIRGDAYRKTSEPLLWMEVYRRVADSDAFLSQLSELSARFGIDGCLDTDQRRHVEAFVPLSSP